MSNIKNSQIWNSATADFRKELTKLRSEALKKLNDLPDFGKAVASVKKGNALFAEKKIAEAADVQAVVAEIEKQRAENKERAEARWKAEVKKAERIVKYSGENAAKVLAEIFGAKKIEALSEVSPVVKAAIERSLTAAIERAKRSEKEREAAQREQAKAREDELKAMAREIGK